MARRPIGRRRFLKDVAAAGAAATSLELSGLGGEASPGLPWLVGAAEAPITPPLEVGLLMSSGRQLWEPFDGVRLPLLARAVVVERNGRRVALAALDLLGLAGGSLGGMEHFKRQVVAASGWLSEPDQLVLACSHTHTGPESAGLTDLDQTEAFKKWTRWLADQIGLAIRRAAGAARPCALRAGCIAVPGMSLNRRIRTTRGIASVRQQLPPETVLGPEGPTDDDLRVASFDDASGRPAAILVNFTAHPVIEMCIKQVSPDYPGETCQELERRKPGAIPLFLQGACGNVNPPNIERTAASAGVYGRKLAAVADQALGNLETVRGDELDLRWKTIRLPARTLKGEPDSQDRLVRLGALRLGEAAFVSLPGEPFVEIGLAIRRASPWPFTAVVGYTDDYLGYIPTDEAFKNGGYETNAGRWSRLAPGAEPLIRAEAIGLLKTLRT